MELPKNAKVVEVSAYWTWMGEDGIARTKVKPFANVTLKEARENTESVDSLFIGKAFPLLIDSLDIQSMNKEARDHFSVNNRSTCINSFAVVIASPVSRVIGNFFMGINKPHVPARLFNNEKDALKWLKQFLQ